MLSSDRSISQNQSLFHGKKPYRHHGLELASGNRCDHDPKKLARWRLNVPKRKLSITVQDLLKGIENYFHSPMRLPTLFNQTGKLNQDGQPRSNRSEAREAEFFVFVAVIYCTDFATMQVGTPCADGGFIHRSFAHIAKLAGLAELDEFGEKWIPTSRFWDAAARLKKAGAWDVHKIYEEKADGTKRARPAIKAVNPDFLVGLGTISYEKLKALRDYSSRRIKEKKEAYKKKFANRIKIEEDAEQARARLEIKSGIIKTHVKRKERVHRESSEKTIEAYNRARLELQKKLVEKGAAWRDIREALLTKFPSFECWRQPLR